MEYLWGKVIWGAIFSPQSPKTPHHREYPKCIRGIPNHHLMITKIPSRWIPNGQKVEKEVRRAPSLGLTSPILTATFTRNSHRVFFFVLAQQIIPSSLATLDTSLHHSITSVATFPGKIDTILRDTFFPLHQEMITKLSPRTCVWTPRRPKTENGVKRSRDQQWRTEERMCQELTRQCSMNEWAFAHHRVEMANPTNTTWNPC